MSASIVPAASASARALAYSFLIVSPGEFLRLVSRLREPLVIVIPQERGIVNKRMVYTYATVYGGLVIVTRSPGPLQLPSEAIVVEAERLVAPTTVYMLLDKVLQEAEHSET